MYNALPTLTGSEETNRVVVVQGLARHGGRGLFVVGRHHPLHAGKFTEQRVGAGTWSAMKRIKKVPSENDSISNLYDHDYF